MHRLYRRHVFTFPEENAADQHQHQRQIQQRTFNSAHDRTPGFVMILTELGKKI